MLLLLMLLFLFHKEENIMKKMIKSLLVSGLVLASPLAGVVGGQEVNAQTIKETPVTLNVTDSSKLQFSDGEYTSAINFSLETSFLDSISPSTTDFKTADPNTDNTFEIKFIDDRRYTHVKELTAQFVANTIEYPELSQVTIKLDKPTLNNIGEIASTYKPYITEHIVINDKAAFPVINNKGEFATGKGEWGLNFTATELSIPKSADINIDGNNIGNINWKLTNGPS